MAETFDVVLVGLTSPVPSRPSKPTIAARASTPGSIDLRRQGRLHRR
jgi:hypothetical protein